MEEVSAIFVVEIKTTSPVKANLPEGINVDMIDVMAAVEWLPNVGVQGRKTKNPHRGPLHVNPTTFIMLRGRKNVLQFCSDHA